MRHFSILLITLLSLGGNYLIHCFPQIYTEDIDNSGRYEYIVTDLKVIYGAHGVKTNFGYNETSSNKGGFGSVPGCPKSIDEFPWVYYGEGPRCFLAGHKGPCREGEKVLYQIGSPYGICGCECLVEQMPLLVLPNNSDRYIFCQNIDSEDRPHGQIYDKLEKKCYDAFRRGPCKSGAVITYWTKDSLTCQPIYAEMNSGRPELWEMGLHRVAPQDYSLEDYSFVDFIPTNNDCGGHRKLSKVLKICVEPNTRLVS